MKIDVFTLFLVHGLSGFLQIIIFLHLYKIIKRYNGIGWWLLWSLFQITAFMFIFLRAFYVNPFLVILQNFFLITGTMFIYIGIIRFFNKKENLTAFISIVVLSISFNAYFLFVYNDLNIRAVGLSISLAASAFITAYALYKNINESSAKSVKLSILLLSIHIVVMILRAYLIIIGYRLNVFSESTLVNLIPYFDGIAISLLLTFSLTSMVHQRLNAEVDEARKQLLNDIAIRETAEIQLKQYADELKTANEIKDKFYRIIAHDLRSPFNILINLSEVLAEETEQLKPQEIKNISRELNIAVKNQYNLLTDLLNWTRFQTNNMQLNSENIFLFHLVKEQFNELEWIAAQKQIKLQNLVHINEQIYADKQMIKLVLRNLISNALKFTNKNGFIVVTAENAEGFIGVTVEDNGIGIEEEHLKQLLSKEKPISTRGTADEKGTGLGLILCKEIIEKHKGKIDIKSELGKGSSFTCYIPIVS